MSILFGMEEVESFLSCLARRAFLHPPIATQLSSIERVRIGAEGPDVLLKLIKGILIEQGSLTV